MAKTYKIRVKVSRMFSSLSPVDFYVKRDAGYLWDDITWTCLPGYTLENEGEVEIASDRGGGTCWWYLRGSLPGSEGSNILYALLYDLPENWQFQQGQGGKAFVTFGGFKIRETFPDKSKVDTLASWEFVGSC